nr:hypothetical protein [uncultured Emticicia sp.]
MGENQTCITQGIKNRKPIAEKSNRCLGEIEATIFPHIFCYKTAIKG